MRSVFALPAALLIGSGLFFAWGLSAPDLERVWRLHLDLKIGDRPALTASERRLFQDVLTRHPQLARMVEDEAAGILSRHRQGRVDHDYAYLLKTRPEQARLLDEVCTGPMFSEDELREAGAFDEADEPRRGSRNADGPGLFG